MPLHWVGLDVQSAGWVGRFSQLYECWDVQAAVWVLGFSQFCVNRSSVSGVLGFSQLCRCWGSVSCVGAGVQSAAWVLEFS